MLFSVCPRKGCPAGTTMRIALALGWLLAMTNHSDAANPELRRLEPQGGQRGTEVEVKLHGVRLADQPEQILFYQPGIEVVKIESIDPNKVKCRLKIDEDCRLGRHALRLRTSSGLTNLLTFHVSNLKEIAEAEPNNTADQPQTLKNGVTENGVTENGVTEGGVVVNGVVKDGDIDVFAVDVTEGKRLSVEIEGLRLGRTLFDPLLELRDQQGELLASSDDQPAAQQDAFVTMRAKKSGKIFIRVHEVAFRGSDAATYRLHVGNYPRPAGVFPPAVVAGSTAQLRWIGPTFDDAMAESTTSVEIPASDKQTYEIHAADDNGISPTGLPLLLCETAPILEIEPNNHRKEPTEIPGPCVVCGVISKPQDRDYYKFTMKKGQQWDFRLRARELRSPLDGVIHLFGPDGKYLKGNDDDQGKPDSYFRYKAPADGEYTVDVEDRLLRGRKEMVYALEITKPQPTVHLSLDERRRYISQVINVPQGGRTAAMVTLKRDYVGGSKEVEFNDLPEGTTAEPGYVIAGFYRTPMLIEAKQDAPLASKLVKITAKLSDKETPILSPFRQKTWLVRGRNNVDVWNHYTDRAAVTVTKKLPFDVRLVQPKAPLVQGGSMEMKVVATREEGFDKSIGVRTLYNPPGVSTNQSRSITKDKTEALVPITANNKARVGQWKIVFLGRTNMNGTVECATQLITLKVAEPYFNVQLPSLTFRRGESIEMKVPITQRHEFTGEAQLTLVRLPTGVTANQPTISKDGKEALFNVKVAADARVGRHRGVGCQIELQVEGEPVRYSQGYVDMFVDPASKAKTAANSKPPEGQAS